VPALAAYYLSHVIRQAMDCIGKTEQSRLSGGRISWSLNLSVPAQYADDGAVPMFRTVGKVAMRWAKRGVAREIELAALRKSFEQEQSNQAHDVDVAVFPEIIAALHQLIGRRDTPDGIHGFLDIGGGTLDGCIFRLWQDGRERRTNILSAKVEALGTVVVAKKALAHLYLKGIEREVEPAIINGLTAEKQVMLPLNYVADEVQRFVGVLMVDARDKMPGNRLQHDSAAAYDPRIRQPRDSFSVHMTGGGAPSHWYRTTAEETHAKFQHEPSGILKYRFLQLAAPRDYGQGADLPFGRFVVAFGLTAEPMVLESLRVKLPSELKTPPPLPPRPPPTHHYE
jgi:hypothetical protein